MRPDRLPAPARFLIYAAVLAAVLYLALAPSDSVPGVRLWDKAQHALTWAGLALLGLAFWPRRPWAIAAFTLVFGVAVEVLQASLPLGRSGDFLDFLADAVGVAAALGLALPLRRRAA